MQLFLWILSLILAYLIGSINPAYILGKLVKHIDIRKYGTKNAGAMNAGHVIGKWAGILTALFDVLKGIIAFYVTFLIFKIPIGLHAPSVPLAAYLAGFLAIVGHDFPFYLNFRGGKGAATTYGLIVLLNIFLFKSILTIYGINALMPLIFSGVIFVLCGTIFYYIQRSANLISIILSPIWFLIVWINTVKYNFILLVSIMIFYYLFTLLITGKNLRKIKKEIRFGKRKNKINVSRKLLRLSAIIFPFLYLIIPKLWILLILVVSFLFFVYQDMARAMKKSHLKTFYKKSDRKISNLTLFLLGCIITIALFQKEHAILAISMMIIGDMAAGIVGIKFGKKILVWGKSIEGAFACFVGSLLIGILLMPLLNLSIYVVGIAAVVITIVELFSAWLDNLTMAPAIALVLKFLPRLGL